MEPPPAEGSRLRAPGGGGKARNRLGLKRTSRTAASAAPGSSAAPVPPPPPPPTPTPAALTPTPAATTPTTPLSSSSPVAPTSSSPVTPTSIVPPWFYPHGGFQNFIQQTHYPPQAQLQGQNFHLVCQTTTLNTISPPPPPNAYGTATPPTNNKPMNIEIDEDDNNDANRATQKRHWTHEEEERLASAWLNASKDTIKGNDKKGDTFWKEVTDEYNKKGNGKRIREINQLKVHWSRLKTSINDFNGYWTKVTQMHTSGYSDDMLEDEAQKMYANKFGKRFPLVHWWKKLKDEPKWRAQFEETEKNKNEVVDVPDEQSRPIGRDAARGNRSGKRKKENIMEGIIMLGETIDKIVKVHHDRKEQCEKSAEAQIKISDKNLEAAKEQKEAAKDQKEAKMFEVYNSLLNQNTSQMSENQKANREKVIRKIEEKLFGA